MSRLTSLRAHMASASSATKLSRSALLRGQTFGSAAEPAPRYQPVRWSMARWSTRTVVLRYALALACGFALLPLRAQEPPPTVHVIAIGGTIDLGLAPFLSRVIQEAHTSGAAAVL